MYIYFPSCRAFNVPYYIGIVVPFLIIYLFNWIVFFIIIFSLLHKTWTSKNFKKKQKNFSFVRQQLIIVTVLSIFFGLGWGIGLIATQDIYDNKFVRDVVASLFVIITAFHGLFLFIMHCLRSEDVRNVWKQVCYGKFSGQFQMYHSHTRSSENTATLKKKVSTSTLPLEEVMKIDKKMAKEEEAGMEVSTFNQTTIVLDTDGEENEKQEMKKELSNAEVKMEESSFAVTLECVDDDRENEVDVDPGDPKTNL